MKPEYNKKWDKTLKSLVSLSGLLLIAVSAVALIGWLTGIRFLISLKTEFIPIAPATAMCFMLFGVIFLLSKSRGKKSIKLLSLTLLLLVAFYCILIIAGYILEKDLALENLLFPVVEKVGRFPVSHVSPYTAFLMVICSISLIVILSDTRDLVTRNITATAGLIIAFTGDVSVIGYLFGTPFLYSGNAIPMAAQTAFAFMVTGSAILFLSGGDNFFLRHLTGITPYSHLLRIFIPFALGVFVIEGILEVTLIRFLGINHAVVLVLMSLLSISVGIPLIIYITQTIFRNATNAENERFRIMNELRKNSAFQSLILENTPVGLCMLTNEKIQWTNNEFRDILGLTENECNEKTVAEILFSFTGEDSEQLLSFFIKPEIKIDKTIRLNLKKGPIWCRFLGSPIDSSYSSRSFVFLIEDITERKQQREMMRLLSHALSSLSECVSITDTKNKLIYVNKAFEDTYGYSLEELTGKNISIVSPENKDQQHSGTILESTKSGGWSGELINRRKDGTEFHIFLNTSIITDEKGEKLALVGVASDITSQIAAEKKLIEYNQKLKESDEAKDKLLRIISHDLKSPFSGILGYLELMETQADSLTEEEKKSFLSEMRKTSENTYKLLDNLLTWARAQKGGIKVAAIEFSIQDAVAEQVEVLSEAASKKNITIINQTDSERNVFADRDMIKTILLNLVNNAIKFTPAGGEIKISSKITGALTEISVTDNGVGIREENLEKLFRIDHSSSTPGTEREKGTGLGLLICKEFAEMNGGSIRVESKPEKGSSFTFSIPLSN